MVPSSEWHQLLQDRPKRAASLLRASRQFHSCLATSTSQRFCSPVSVGECLQVPEIEETSKDLVSGFPGAKSAAHTLSPQIDLRAHVRTVNAKAARNFQT